MSTRVDRAARPLVGDRWLWALLAAQLLGGAVSAVLAPQAVLAGLVPVLLSVAAVLLARSDWRVLGRDGGFERFHWLWAVFPPVYVVGRGIFLHRATGTGLVRTVVYAALLALGYVVPTLGRIGDLL